MVPCGSAGLLRRLSLCLVCLVAVVFPASPRSCRTPAEQLLCLYLAIEYGNIDISEHASTLRLYASRVHSVAEIGVRKGASTWALMMGLHDADPPVGGSMAQDRRAAKVHLAYDLGPFRHQGQARYVAAGLGIRYAFEQADSLELELEDSDLLFIDTFHAYPQLRLELRRHARHARQYIILHDTTVDGNTSECLRMPEDYDCGAMARKLGCSAEEVRMGLWPAVQEFLAGAPEWSLLRRYDHNNGLTVLRRHGGFTAQRA